MADRFINEAVLNQMFSESTARVFKEIVREHTTEEVIKAVVYGIVNGDIKLKKAGATNE